MADEPAQSLAEGSAAAAIRRGVAACPRSPGGPGLADRNPRRAVSFYAAWVHQNQPLPALLGRYATLRPGTPWW
jgi:hypothetical protein